jgi:xanthine dehydrogenase accessory factor
LIRLAPAEKIGANPQEGVTEMTLTCMSGGTLDIYLEPYYPPPHLLVIGHHSAAQALAALAKTMEYTVTAAGEVAPDDFSAADHLIKGLDFSQIDFQPNMYVVVASHGNYDEIALQAALPSRAAYVALVASKKRTETIQNYLRDSGMPEELLARLKYPAGLDIGAITPHEIALSILAEIVEFRRHGKIPLTGVQSQPKEQPKTAVDPICKMTVEIATARYKTEYHGQMVYFCSAHCQDTFDKDPESYIQATAGLGSRPERQHTIKSPRGVSQ